MTTVDDVRNYFIRGKEMGAKYMIVWCDSFSWEDYPAFYDTKEEAIISKNNPEAMQKYMESYNLSFDMEFQLSLPRSHAL